MTDEEILIVAEACGMMLISLGLDEEKIDFSILTFAKFIGKAERFKEREACAQVAEHSFGVIGSTIAQAIRARGEQA